MDGTVSFQPEVGVPITRRRTTAPIEVWPMSVVLYNFAQLAEFETWFNDDLAQGALPFVWRHPVSKVVTRFKFMPATFDTSYPGGEWVRLSFTVMTVPGRLWFAPYVPEESAKVPDFVADYENDRYWLGQEEVTLAELIPVSGPHDVLTQQLTYTRTWSFVNYGGGFVPPGTLPPFFAQQVPQTQPANVDWIAGFARAT